MNDHYFLNEDHTYRPCSLIEWGNQLRAMDRRISHQIINNHLISTVWLGLNHNYNEGPPLLFETMVFEDENIGTEIYMDRYTTWEEAIEGHKKAVAWCLDGCKNESR